MLAFHRPQPNIRILFYFIVLQQIGVPNHSATSQTQTHNIVLHLSRRPSSHSPKWDQGTTSSFHNPTALYYMIISDSGLTFLCHIPIQCSSPTSCSDMPITDPSPTSGSKNNPDQCLVSLSHIYHNQYSIVPHPNLSLSSHYCLTSISLAYIRTIIVLHPYCSSYPYPPYHKLSFRSNVPHYTPFTI